MEPAALLAAAVLLGSVPAGAYAALRLARATPSPTPPPPPRCHACGYDLAGLSDPEDAKSPIHRTRCPECGDVSERFVTDFIASQRRFKAQGLHWMTPTFITFPVIILLTTLILPTDDAARLGLLHGIIVPVVAALLLVLITPRLHPKAQKFAPFTLSAGLSLGLTAFAILAATGVLTPDANLNILAPTFAAAGTAYALLFLLPPAPRAHKKPDRQGGPP